VLRRKHFDGQELVVDRFEVIEDQVVEFELLGKEDTWRRARKLHFLYYYGPIIIRS
jgi:hypothetical protein